MRVEKERPRDATNVRDRDRPLRRRRARPMKRRYHQPAGAGKLAAPICIDCRRAKRPHCVFCAAWEVLP